MKTKAAASVGDGLGMGLSGAHPRLHYEGFSYLTTKLRLRKVGHGVSPEADPILCVTAHRGSRRAVFNSGRLRRLGTKGKDDAKSLY
jgi:hypothetical protein